LSKYQRTRPHWRVIGRLRTGFVFFVIALVLAGLQSISASAWVAASFPRGGQPTFVEQVGCGMMECVYLPVISVVPQQTPTAPTATNEAQTPVSTSTAMLTPTPTVTLTPTQTPTPTITRTPAPRPANPLIVQIRLRPGIDQRVEIRNVGDAAAVMTGWTLSDADTPPYVYTFKPFTLAGGASVWLWNKIGVDTATNLYWNLGGVNVWNDNRDTATLRNSDGEIISQCAYEDRPGDVANCQ
jgi:hypothetical protein